MITIFNRTTKGWVGEVNGIRKWFIRPATDGKYEVYEIVDGNDGCLLRIVADDLLRAKAYVYVTETGVRFCSATN